MARWRLLQKHYLKVPGTEWDYKETTNTGRQKRLVLPVPMYLDPDNTGDHNYPGEIIVAHEGSGFGRDIIFEGPPTPDMEALDDEARAISAKLRPSWEHPIEKIGDGPYADAVERALEKLLVRAGGPPATPTGPSMDDFAALQKMVAELSASNAALTQQLLEGGNVRRPIQG